MPDDFAGIFAATVTPMTSTQDVDYSAIKPLTDRLVAAGIHGLVPCGGTGEFTTLTFEERDRRLPGLRRGSGRPHPGRPAHRRTKYARDRGFDRPSRGHRRRRRDGRPTVLDRCPGVELHAHFKAVASAVSIPIVVYGLPGSTKIDLGPEQGVGERGHGASRFASRTAAGIRPPSPDSSSISATASD